MNYDDPFGDGDDGVGDDLLAGRSGSAGESAETRQDADDGAGGVDDDDDDDDDDGELDWPRFKSKVESSYGVSFDFGYVVGASLDFVKHNALVYVGVTLMYVFALVGLAFAYGDSVFESGLPYTGRDLFPAYHGNHYAWYWHHRRQRLRHIQIDATGVLHFLSLWVDFVLIWNPLLACFYKATFNGMRSADQSVRFLDFLYYYSRPRQFLRIMLVGTIFFLLTFLFQMHWVLGFVYIYYQAVVAFVIPLLVEYRGLNVLHLFWQSAIIAHGHIGWVLLIIITSVLLQILGLLAMIVGILFTIPLALVLLAFAYHHLMGVRGVESFQPMSVT